MLVSLEATSPNSANLKLPFGLLNEELEPCKGGIPIAFPLELSVGPHQNETLSGAFG